MKKRHFLASASLASLAGVLTPGAASARPAGRPGPGLLTVSGDIGRANRGPVDAALDQMLAKHGVRFDKAMVFDDAALQQLPAVRIRPTLEYDARQHTLAGPLLTSVLQAAGVAPDSAVTVTLRAADGYTVPIALADARALRMIVATELDDRPLALGGLGPQWALVEADVLPGLKDKPLRERFAQCPWALYSIEVKRG